MLLERRWKTRHSSLSNFATNFQFILALRNEVYKSQYKMEPYYMSCWTRETWKNSPLRFKISLPYPVLSEQELSFLLMSIPGHSRARNPVIAYFLNKFNSAFILFFFSLLVLALFTSSISYAVKKRASHFKKACFKSSLSIIGSGLSIQLLWYFPQPFNINSVTSARWIVQKCHFIMPLPWFKTRLVPYQLSDLL